MNFNAPLDSVGKGMGPADAGLCSHRVAKTQAQGGGTARLLAAWQPWHRLGNLSLAARRERHGNLSLMSELGVLTGN